MTETADPRVRRSECCAIQHGLTPAFSGAMIGIGKRFVYILESERDPRRHYTGVTSDVERRLEWHNSGPSGHTATGRPWRIAVVVEFSGESQAIRFEKYLKSGSGRAFAIRHFSG